MSLAGTLLLGVVSGLLTTAVLEGTIRLRRRFDQQKLRSVLAISGKRCTILFGSLTGLASHTRVVGVNEAVGLAHLLEICRHLKITPMMLPSAPTPTYDPKEGLISVGGPLSNPITADYLEQFCRGFEPHFSDDAEEFPEGKLMDGWRCGQSEFTDSEERVFGFLVRLTPSLISGPSVVHLLFGRSVLGTAAAAYYLSEHYERIFQHYRSRDVPYFFAIHASRARGYRSVSVELIDITYGAISTRRTP